MKLREKKFKDEIKRKEMLNMRRQGWTYEAIAMFYGVDHSSIYFWCKREQIPAPSNPISFQSLIPLIVSDFKPKEVREKTYSEYLELERRKRFPKLYLLNKQV